MFYVPLNYDSLNSMAGRYSPSMVKAYNNATYAYWERSLFQRACSRIKTTLPDNWEGSRRDFLLFCLLKLGFVFVSYSDKAGYWFNPGSLYGIDFYYQPTEFILANPKAGEVLGYDQSYRFQLHKEDELLKFMPDYRGIFDIISYYAEKLSALDNAINMSIINNKFAFILAAKNKATAEALKKVMDKINKGEPAVFVGENGAINSENVYNIPVKQNFVADDIQLLKRKIINEFLTDIGINNTNLEKRERLTDDEVNANNDEVIANIQHWMDNLKDGISRINKLYNLNMSVELRKFGGESNVDTTELD